MTREADSEKSERESSKRLPDNSKRERDRPKRERDSAKKGEGSSSRRGGPPRLKLSLINKLKVLALANIIPLLLALWMFIGWMNGDIAFNAERLGTKGGLAAVLFVICCGVIAVSTWFILPVANWMRDYPAWFYRNRSKSLWLLPMICGYGFWLVMWILLAVAAIVTVALLCTGAYLLLEVFGIVGGDEVGDQPDAVETSWVID